MSGPIARSAVRRLVVPSLLLLSGCWSGDSFYAPSDARPAIPEGLYRVTSAAEGAPPTLRVSILANGMTQIDARNGRRPGVLGFAPLDPQGRRLAWWQPSSGDPGEREQSIYGLLEHEEDGSFVLHMPSCDKTAAIARAAGATVETHPLGITECRFHDRGSLEAALRQLRPDEDDPDGGVIRLDPADHGAR